MSETKYTTSNYIAVNKFIDNEYDRSRDKIKFQRSLIFRRYAIYGSLLILALSLLIFSIFFAHWLFKSTPENIISNVKNEYVTNTYNLDEDIAILKKLVQDIESENQSYSDQEGEKIVINEAFTHFRMIKLTLESGRNSDVVTGIKYNPDNLSSPTKQYCYVELYGGKKRISFDIADKFNKQNINYLSYDISSMKDLISRKDFIEAKRLCKFRN